MRILFVIYDNDSYTNWFPQGIGYLAAVLRENGHQVEIWNQDLHHWPDERLTRVLDSGEPYDVVGIGVIAGYYQYRRLLGLAEAVNKAQGRPFLVIGGHGPSPEPEYFMKVTGADAVVIGEGELTIVDLLEARQSGRPLATVPGLAFRDGDRIVINPRRELIQDIDKLPWPAYDLFPIEIYRLLRMPNCVPADLVMPMLSGRGCTFTCTFCYRMDEGFRPRSAQSILEEIRFLQEAYNITYIDFSDELLMSSVDRTNLLCEEILSSGLQFKWSCNGRLNYAKPKVLSLMKRAGCVFINYGIEALDDEVLKAMKKGLTTKLIVEGVRNTLAEGMSPGLNIIFGNLGDTRETLNKAVQFLLQYDDGSQLRTIRPVTPYPGSELYYYAIKKGLLRDVEEFYEEKHVNSDLISVNCTNMTDAEVHEALLEANTQLIRRHFSRKVDLFVSEARKLYQDRNAGFRGFRQH